MSRLLAISTEAGRPAPAPETAATDLGPDGTAALVLRPHDHSFAEPDLLTLRERVLTGKGLSELSAPFAGVAAENGALTAATDWLGMRQLYGIQGEGWAAIGTSARELGLLAGRGPDHEALGVYRLVGHFLDQDTAFDGVTTLRAGHGWTLADGRLTENEIQPGDFRAERAPSAEEAVRELAEVLRASMEHLLDEYPDAVLQLSGGLDTRLVLAAIPPARRVGLGTLTLSASDSGDAATAALLAERTRMRREVIDLAELERLDPPEVHRLVLEASRRHEQILNPLHLALLDWVEERTDDAPRISGLGGELARGMYYPMQRQHPGVTPKLVDRLAKWRIFSLDPVDAACLDPVFARESTAATMSRLHDIFGGITGDWLSATDAYYYRQRYHRAVGGVITSSCTEHTGLNPLLHPRFVAIAETLPPSVKRGSRFNARLLSALDPDLASLPMDTGVRPSALMAPRPLALVRTARDKGTKIVHKTRQRLSRRGDAGSVHSALARSLVAHWRSEPRLLEPVAASGLVDLGWMDRLLAGPDVPAPATTGFIALLEAALSPG
ncbi:hypothetical protein AGRA3207_007073 [Actinomadura graeca]|uniref:Asparagine synthetase domain-containing protein n=1 Tax=Actinomadura graeca TaxID=2750812 RepID=A0ABX8R3A5_9ACTN|nr:hypothetical protein [Actinomadura graeca]QXJ25561.1 hypothetical protein AGRA3207_007073 [Actinomadura graeca]